MATHPAQNGCLCDWSGDDHYPIYVAWASNCPVHHTNPKERKEPEMVWDMCPTCRGRGRILRGGTYGMG